MGTRGVCSCRAEVGSFQLGKSQPAPWEHQAAFTPGAGVRLTVCWCVQCPNRALLVRNVHFRATWPRKSLTIHVLTLGLVPNGCHKQEPEGEQRSLRLARKPSRGGKGSLLQAPAPQGGCGCQISDPSHSFLGLSCSSQCVTWCSGSPVWSHGSSPNLAVDKDWVHGSVAIASPSLTLLTCKISPSCPCLQLQVLSNQSWSEALSVPPTAVTANSKCSDNLVLGECLSSSPTSY